MTDYITNLLTTGEHQMIGINPGDPLIYKGQKVTFSHEFNNSVWVKMPNGDKKKVRREQVKRPEEF